MDNKSVGELAIFAGGKFKGDYRNGGKQGHKASKCCLNSNVAGDKGVRKRSWGSSFSNVTSFQGTKDCPEGKKAKAPNKTKETGMFVGMCIQESKQPWCDSITMGVCKDTLCEIGRASCRERV